MLRMGTFILTLYTYIRYINSKCLRATPSDLGENKSSPPDRERTASIQ